MRSSGWSSSVLSTNPPLGIYLHWPFCAAICPYCDFNVYALPKANSKSGSLPDIDAWRAAYLAELRHGSIRRPNGPVETVFFGGGTPSLMAPALIDDILAEIDRLWGLATNAEITLEANPVSAQTDQLQAFRAAGVTRLSLGVQALDDAALKSLGRTHSKAEAIAAFEAAQKIFALTSLDLIYARPGQDVASWEAELSHALALQPAHMSLYQLTIEAGTPFQRKADAGMLRVPNEDLAAALFDITQECTERAGLPAYEISNHAGDTAACRHNLNIWQSGDYLGIGPGAHGRISDAQGRCATYAAPGPKDWLARVKIHGHGWVADEPLSPTALRDERLLLGLRLRCGLAYAQIAEWGITLAPSRLTMLRDYGLLGDESDYLQASAAGRRVLDRLIGELVC